MSEYSRHSDYKVIYIFIWNNACNFLSIVIIVYQYGILWYIPILFNILIGYILKVQSKALIYRFIHFYLWMPKTCMVRCVNKSFTTILFQEWYTEGLKL